MHAHLLKRGLPDAHLKDGFDAHVTCDIKDGARDGRMACARRAAGAAATTDGAAVHWPRQVLEHV